MGNCSLMSEPNSIRPVASEQAERPAAAMVRTQDAPPVTAMFSAAESAEFDRLVLEARLEPLSALSEAIGRVQAMAQTGSGFPVARSDDFARIIDEAKRYFDANKGRIAKDKTAAYAKLLALITELDQTTIAAYPAQQNRLRLLHAQILAAQGDHRTALELVAPMALRPQTLENGPNDVADILYFDTRLRAALGMTAGLSRLAIARFLHLCRIMPKRPWAHAHHLFRQMSLAAHAGAPEPGIYAALRQAARIRLHCHRLALRWRIRDILGRIGEIALGFLGRVLNFIGAPYTLGVIWPDAPALAASDRKLLVSRPMGGIGDILMMTPGLAVLARRFRRPVYFATKKQFIPLFDNNPDVIAIDDASELDLREYLFWMNLGFCPAADYESRHAPFVRKGRVWLFGAGMGIDRKTLKKTGTTPRIYLSPAERGERDRWKAALRETHGERPLVGIGLYSRETYRDYEPMLELAQRLADDHVVSLFHHKPPGRPYDQRLLVNAGGSLRDTIVKMSACDYFVSVDTGLLHVTAAFDIPCLAIYGPIDGRLARDTYDNLTLADVSAFPCVPCWRNEDTLCAVSDSPKSACLQSLTVETLLAQFNAMKAGRPVAGAARRR